MSLEKNCFRTICFKTIWKGKVSGQVGPTFKETERHSRSRVCSMQDFYHMMDWVQYFQVKYKYKCQRYMLPHWNLLTLHTWIPQTSIMFLEDDKDLTADCNMWPSTCNYIIDSDKCFYICFRGTYLIIQFTTWLWLQHLKGEHSWDHHHRTTTRTIYIKLEGGYRGGRVSHSQRKLDPNWMLVCIEISDNRLP